MDDLREQVAAAMNPKGQLGDAVAQPEMKLGALAFADDLGRMLWRLKYGQDTTPQTFHRAVLLLARRARGLKRLRRGHRVSRKAMQADGGDGDLLERLAARAVGEWVKDRCHVCAGRGRLGGGSILRRRVTCPECSGARWVSWEERIPFAAPGLVLLWRDPCGTCNGLGGVGARGELQRMAVCGACGGSGRARYADADRAHALRLPLETYRRRWSDVLLGMLAVLDAFDGDTENVVSRQLRVRLASPQDID
ncbi:hypothetical protein ACKI2N_001915 [Cupriavidus sp. 30B13]|uniref:hypothetical protein n=1 Tax=Cupriavidus sp. 30B13 TaxID=3384241 RepID=UPI003B91D794